jgi:hypothetical protein
LNLDCFFIEFKATLDDLRFVYGIIPALPLGHNPVAVQKVATTGNLIESEVAIMLPDWGDSINGQLPSSPANE